MMFRNSFNQSDFLETIDISEFYENILNNKDELAIRVTVPLTEGVDYVILGEDNVKVDIPGENLGGSFRYVNGDEDLFSRYFNEEFTSDNLFKKDFFYSGNFDFDMSSTGFSSVDDSLYDKIRSTVQNDFLRKRFGSSCEVEAAQFEILDDIDDLEVIVPDTISSEDLFYLKLNEKNITSMCYVDISK